MSQDKRPNTPPQDESSQARNQAKPQTNSQPASEPEPLTEAQRREREAERLARAQDKAVQKLKAEEYRDGKTTSRFNQDLVADKP